MRACVKISCGMKENQARGRFRGITFPWAKEEQGFAGEGEVESAGCSHVTGGATGKDGVPQRAEKMKKKRKE